MLFAEGVMTNFIGVDSNSCKVIIERSVYSLLVMTIFLLIPEALFAASNISTNAIAQVICNVVVQVTGPIGQGVATVAVVFVSVGFFMGKTSIGILLATGVGIGMLFGAETIVSMVAGSSIDSCTTNSVTK